MKCCHPLCSQPLGPRPFQTGRGRQRARAPQRHHPPPGTCSDASFYRDGMHFGLFILLSLPISVGAGAELPRPRAVNTITGVTQTHAPLKPAPHRPSRRNSRSRGLGIHRSQSIISSQQGGNVGKKVTSEIARSRLQNRGGISKARNLLMKKKNQGGKIHPSHIYPFFVVMLRQRPAGSVLPKSHTASTFLSSQTKRNKSIQFSMPRLGFLITFARAGEMKLVLSQLSQPQHRGCADGYFNYSYL